MATTPPVTAAMPSFAVYNCVTWTSNRRGGCSAKQEDTARTGTTTLIRLQGMKTRGEGTALHCGAFWQQRPHCNTAAWFNDQPDFGTERAAVAPLRRSEENDASSSTQTTQRNSSLSMAFLYMPKNNKKYSSFLTSLSSRTAENVS